MPLPPILRFVGLMSTAGPIPQHRPDLGRCWVWTSPLLPSGYASFSVDGRTRRPHRWIYELLVGPVPTGLVLDHLCRVRHCVNPGHLEPVTSLENVLRGHGSDVITGRRVRCINGHQFTPKNTYRHGRKLHCRACRNAAQQRYLARKKVA